MVDKSELLKQMRKHAKNFSSAMNPAKKINKRNINHALALIDLFAKESIFGSSKKLSIEVPNFLKCLRIEENLDFLKEAPGKKSLSNSSQKSNNNNKDKIKLAEKKLLKLLSTKSC